MECPIQDKDEVDVGKIDEIGNLEQVKVSRSGRVVKPRTLHDL